MLQNKHYPVWNTKLCLQWLEKERLADERKIAFSIESRSVKHAATPLNNNVTQFRAWFCHFSIFQRASFRTAIFYTRSRVRHFLRMIECKMQKPQSPPGDRLRHDARTIRSGRTCFFLLTCGISRILRWIIETYTSEYFTPGSLLHFIGFTGFLLSAIYRDADWMRNDLYVFI